jgi:hypothetical protein
MSSAKDIIDQFTPEEHEHLSYPGSMLHREPTEEEEFERYMDIIERDKQKKKKAR